MASMNPFRRKQMQVLGLDNASFVSSRTSRSSEDGSSTISHFSDRASAHSGHSRSNSVRHSSSTIPQDLDQGGYSDGESRTGIRDGDSRSLSFPTHSEASYDHTRQNPFEEEEEDEEDDSLDELEGKPTGLRRRRTVPSKAGSMLGSDHDNPWRTSTRIGNHSTHGRGSPDVTQVPLKAQKTLGLSRQGKMVSQEDYRRVNSLSPQTENVAPKAQRMLGIPSNPFQRSKALEPSHLFHDELERHGSKGPTSMTMSRKPMDVGEFSRFIMSGERNVRDSTSTTDMSSLSRDSMMSSQPDTHIDTPRSSHELLTRPPLPRIATDPMADTSASLTEPWSMKPLASSDIHNTSPILNKPLPKTPEHTFELAGSEPIQTTRKTSATKSSGVPEPIAELPTPPEIAELPSEPVIYELAAADVPGSSSCPVELPAREASPVDPPFISRSLNTHFPQAKTAPNPPPPRRAGTTRSAERQKSKESLATRARHLSTQISEPSLQKSAQSARPLNRSNSSHLDRSPTLNTSSSSSSIVMPENITLPPSPTHKTAPLPPPSRYSIPVGDSTGIVLTQSASNRPVTPTGKNTRANADSPQSRLPPIQTSPAKTTTPQGTPIADSMVSAITQSSNDIISPGGVSTLSPSSPASRRAGLNVISKAAGNKDRQSKEAKKRERRREENHQREWSWEPGKIDRIDSIRREREESILEEPIEEAKGDEDETSENEPDNNASDNNTLREQGSSEHSSTAEHATGTTAKIDVLADLDLLQREVDDALKDQAEESPMEERESDLNLKDQEHGPSEQENVTEDNRGKFQSHSADVPMKQTSNHMPEGNWI